MPRHKADTFIDPEEIEEYESVLLAKVQMLSDKVAKLEDLIKWVGDHIHVRNANGQRTTAKCALCPFTYRKDSRGRMVKDVCRHDQIWQIS